jgi:hypothetical protein
MTNPYEDAARQRKVTALVAVLLAVECTADDAERMDDNGWANAAAAGLRRGPSAETRALVVEALRAHERARAAAPAGPFACFAGTP